jgi:hypothetical protein
MLAMAIALSDVVPAQSPPPGSKRAISVWVDPTDGNDSLALQLNVTVLNPVLCLGTEIAPADVLDTAGRPLLHQPYPFKTITAAVGYINSLPPTVSATDPLPYLSPTTGIQWDCAVIHLLPGRYASQNNLEQQSRQNQLHANGETFPIQLPNRVSIQGTSALDTVIELERGEGPAFLLGETTMSRGIETFISSIAVMGGGSHLVFYPPPPSLPPPAPQRPAQYACAAIALSREHACSLRLDDCFFFGNGVGVLTDRDPEGAIVHQVAILNCNFVWNVAGIWSGDVLSLTPTTGAARFLLVNNIFDTSPPPLYTLNGQTCGTFRPFPLRWALSNVDMWSAFVYGPQQMSAFEGLDAIDLQVVTPVGLRNFNAYELGATARFDKRVPRPTMFLPATGPQVTAPPGPSAGFDLAPYTGATQTPELARGVLFVADLFRNGIPLGTGNPTQRFATASSCEFDLSPMDFRLAPAVALAHVPSQAFNVPGDPSAGGALNPLVDRGYGDFPMLGLSGVTLAAHPRALPIGNGTWPFASWSDFDDCEGFGNRRVFDHPAYPNQGPSTVPIDVGADEEDLVKIAGFRYGTRIFTARSDANFHIDNRYVWALGAPSTLAAQPPGQQPQLLSYSANWWASPGPAAYNNLGWIGWVNGAPSTTYYNPLVAQITPHLLPDVHPYHAVTISGQWPSNPVWQDCGPLQPFHNVFLYIDPTEPLPNPAGVYPAVPVPGFAFLDGISSPWSGHQLAAGGSQRYPFGFPNNGGRYDLGGALEIKTFGAWCQSYSGPSGTWPGTSYREAHVLGDAVGSPAYNTWNNVYPHLDPKDTSPPNQTQYVFQTNGVQRLSVELIQLEGGTLLGYLGPSNVQTFMIWRQTSAQ